MGKQGVALENHGDAALGGRQQANVAIPEDNAAGRLIGKSGDDAQKRGFAASRWSHDDNELAIGDAEIEAIDHNRFVVAVRAVFEDESDHQRELSKKYAKNAVTSPLPL